MEMRERRLIFVLACVQFTHVLDFVMLMPLGPIVIREFALSAQKFAWLVSAYTFAAAGAGLLLSKQMDRISRRSMLLGLYGVLILATLACGLAKSFEVLLFARILAGASGGILNGVLLSIVGDEIPPERRGRATGTILSAFAVASVVGIPASLALARTFGWSTPFLALSALSTVIWFFVRGLTLTSSQNHRGLTSSGRFAFSTVAPALVGTVALMIASFAVVPFVSTALVANVKVSESNLIWVYSAAGTLTFLASRYFGVLSDKWGRLRVFQAVALSSIIGVLLITHLTQSPLWIAIGVTSLFMVLNSGRNVPLLALLLDTIPKEHRGRFMVLNSSSQQFAYGIGAYLAGLLVHLEAGGGLEGFRNVGYLAGVFTCIAVWAVSRTQRQVSQVLPVA